MSTFFITAIDTDAGKTITTGLLAAYMKSLGLDITTMKLAQTGCVNISDDITTHRFLMSEPLSNDDVNGASCSYLFKFPASPNLSAALEEQEIDLEKLINDIRNIQQKYQHVLVEGVGGLMVPLTNSTLVTDFIVTHDFPVILVTSGRLGSINHTLLTLEVLKHRGLSLYGVVYNNYPVTAPEITDESRLYLHRAVKNYFPDALWGEVPQINMEHPPVYIEGFEGWFLDL